MYLWIEKVEKELDLLRAAHAPNTPQEEMWKTI
jgi:hypothetical protein